MTTTRTWPGYSISSSMLLGDVVGENGGLGVGDLLGLDHDVQLATGLHGIGALDALVGVGDLLELLEALYVGVSADSRRAPGRAAEMASAAWTRTSSTVSGSTSAW